MTSIEYGGTADLEALIRDADDRGDDYQIMYDDDDRIILWVTIGDTCYENAVLDDERTDLYWSEDALAEAESYWRQ